jgi:hypothetical protein
MRSEKRAEGCIGLRKQKIGSGGQTRAYGASLHGSASSSAPMGGRSCPIPWKGNEDENERLATAILVHMRHLGRDPLDGKHL